MRRNHRAYCLAKQAVLLFLLLQPRWAAAQNAQQKQLMAIVSGLKQLKTYSYHYTVSASFEAGREEQFEGDLYMDQVSRNMLNKSDLAVILLTPQWFYRADHGTHAISLFDLEKYYQKHSKAARPEAFFQGDMVAGFLDSVVLQYGRLKSCEVRGGIAAVSLTFPQNAYLSSLDLSYDMVRKLPVSLKMVTAYTEQVDGKARTISRAIVCSHYTTEVDPRLFKTTPYFNVSSGKAELKQFRNYKLYATL